MHSTRKEHAMNARIKQLGIALVAAAAFAVPPAAADRPATLAGPSYTSTELQSLKAFSGMTFAAKQAYLAGLVPTTAAHPALPSDRPEQQQAPIASPNPPVPHK